METSFSDAGEESFLLVYLSLFGSIFYLLWLRRDATHYQNIPAVGFSGRVTSFISALRWLHDPAGVIQKGYSKFQNGIFRYPTLTRWIVVIAKPKYVEELRKAPEEEVSASEAMNEILGIPFTIRSDLLGDQELKSLLGAQLTRHLHEFLADIHSVVSELATNIISTGDDDWKYIDEVELMTRISVQVINHTIVGAPLSRNSEFVDLMVTLARNLERYAKNLKKFPEIFKPVYIFLFTPLPRIRRRLSTLLVSVLEDRHKLLNERVDTLPNDMISWFVSNDAKAEISVDDLVAHVLLVNHLALHPVVRVMSQALRNLALHPDHVKLLRKEVEAVTRQGGWTKTSVDKMRRMDAFLKETMRMDTSALNPYIPNLTMARKCRRAITFSDGTTVPQNAILFVGSQLLHKDVRYYSKPETFNPLRFAPPPTTSDSPQISPTSSSDSYSASSWASTSSSPVFLTLPATSSTFLAWGHGKHACPGRFFAASVMKLMLAQLVLEFDFRPPPLHDNDGDDRKQRTNQVSESLPWIEMRRCRH